MRLSIENLFTASSPTASGSGSPLSTRIHWIRNAVPLALLTLAYGLQSFAGVSPAGIEQKWLARLYAIEFLAIHSYPFMMAVLIWRPSSDKVRGLRLFFAGTLGLLYVLAAHSIGAWPGVVALLSLMGGTYFGFLLKGVHRSLLPELIIRGIVNLVLFMACAIVFDLPEDVEEWVDQAETILAGFTYFLLLTMLEVNGFPERLIAKFRRNTARAAADTPEERIEVPMTKRGLREAGIPLLASIGLAVAPYIVLPFIAGAGGRFIDETVGWPRGDDLIAVWYFMLYGSVIALVRSWQLRMVMKGGRVSRYRVFLAVLWLVYAAAACGSFFSTDSVRFAPLWTLEDAGWMMGVDFVISFVLVPFVWARVSAARSHQGAGPSVRTLR